MRVNCPHCGQEMNPPNLVKHEGPCLQSRGRFLNGKELSVKEIKNLRRVLKSYEMSVDDYLSQHNKQKGKCAICGQSPKGNRKRLGVDHCHSSGKIRGLLCNRCNVVIGQADEDVELLQEMIEYLSLVGD